MHLQLGYWFFLDELEGGLILAQHIQCAKKFEADALSRMSQ